MWLKFGHVTTPKNGPDETLVLHRVDAKGPSIKAERGAVAMAAPWQSRDRRFKWSILTSRIVLRVILEVSSLPRKVDIRLPGKGDSISHGARPVHQIISMIKWIRTSRLSIKNSLSSLPPTPARLRSRPRVWGVECGVKGIEAEGGG